MVMSPFYDSDEEYARERSGDGDYFDSDYMTNDELAEWDSIEEQERREESEHGPWDA